MNAITFHVPDETSEKIREIADARGVSVDALLSDFTADMVKQYEAHQIYLEMAQQGETEVDEALTLLRR